MTSKPLIVALQKNNLNPQMFVHDFLDAFGVYVQISVICAIARPDSPIARSIAVNLLVNLSFAFLNADSGSTPICLASCAIENSRSPTSSSTRSGSPPCATVRDALAVYAPP